MEYSNTINVIYNGQTYQVGNLSTELAEFLSRGEKKSMKSLGYDFLFTNLDENNEFLGEIIKEQILAKNNSLTASTSLPETIPVVKNNPTPTVTNDSSHTVYQLPSGTPNISPKPIKRKYTSYRKLDDENEQKQVRRKPRLSCYG